VAAVVADDHLSRSAQGEHAEALASWPIPVVGGAGEPSRGKASSTVSSNRRIRRISRYRCTGDSSAGIVQGRPGAAAADRGNHNIAAWRPVVPGGRRPALARWVVRVRSQDCAAPSPGRHSVRTTTETRAAV